MYFILRLLFTAAGLFVAAWLVPGITAAPPNYAEMPAVLAGILQPLDAILRPISFGHNEIVTILVVAVIFGIVNAVIKPILSLLTCPLFILTLGLFTFVVNALMLLLTSAVATRLGLPFTVDGFWAALIGSIVVSIVSFVLSVVLREERGRQ